MTNTNEIPYGLCECGCGQKTSIAKRNRTAKGYVKGEPIRFCHGHQKFPTALDRFWAKVQKTDDGCWMWIGGKDSSGYGTFHTGERTVSAHRYSYELHIGPIPEGMLCCHHCDRPACCNPAHFFLGTKRDNAIDMVRKGRRKGGQLHGEGHTNVKLTEDKVRAMFVDREKKMTMQVISDKYEVSLGQVSKILRKERWAHLWK